MAAAAAAMAGSGSEHRPTISNSGMKIYDSNCIKYAFWSIFYVFVFCHDQLWLVRSMRTSSADTCNILYFAQKRQSSVRRTHSCDWLESFQINSAFGHTAPVWIVSLLIHGPSIDLIWFDFNDLLNIECVWLWMVWARKKSGCQKSRRQFMLAVGQCHATPRHAMP